MTQPEPAPTGGHPLLRKTTQALAVMVCVLAVPYATPRLARLRVVRAPWDHTHRDFASSDGVPAPITRVGETKLSATKNRATVTNALPDDDRVPLDAAELAKAAGSVAIEDPTGEMGAFYKRLAATLRGDKGAVTRILHYGDSVIASDYVSGTMRRRMQERFGDAGHGFIATANPWEWYFHNDVSHRASDGWSVSRITGPLVRDGMYGLGGASFHTTGVATATFGTAARGEFGRKVSRFDVYYLEQPWGGSFQMEVHGRAPVVVSTRGPAKVSRKVSVSVPDGAASMTIRTLGGGDVRMFGVVLERDVPGVVYDALGALGGRANLWEAMNAEHWKEQLQLRDPALVILQYGTNESEMGHIDDALYTKWMTDLIGKVRDAVPSAFHPRRRAARPRGEGRRREPANDEDHPPDRRAPGEDRERREARLLEHVRGDGRQGLDGEVGQKRLRRLRPHAPVARGGDHPRRSLLQGARDGLRGVRVPRQERAGARRGARLTAPPGSTSIGGGFRRGR